MAAQWSALRFAREYEQTAQNEPNKVFPKFGGIVLQGDAAQEAAEQSLRALVEGARRTAVELLGARPLPEEQPEGLPVVEPSQLEEEEFLDHLQLLCEYECLDCTDPAFAAALARVGLMHYIT
mmetsp:Transcript_64900/g.159794  ORF Transcript_64900/g.159794 Transcript_64900/m.159794 type:complete len:123 (+) Transcript_64900:215-583(+)|eukprot:CAMPEP_0206219550 /NCGR_PEP_ID=MMETSP0047_2-20121206/4374_1 /ASSEMBLY_ACC=CAM_ASM_000192 /TAXON_ID=195065 /ORGANISM="Chroomonas mesostigmatica_cf, Strain CCMP1168" /LENGTH=122 /DNA_ID=CAMNT_0053642091 /DNA_START=308 /DNA_END=676 /DNA_ORIENTATION=+